MQETRAGLRWLRLNQERSQGPLITLGDLNARHRLWWTLTKIRGRVLELRARWEVWSIIEPTESNFVNTRGLKTTIGLPLFGRLPMNYYSTPSRIWEGSRDHGPYSLSRNTDRIGWKWHEELFDSSDEKPRDLEYATQHYKNHFAKISKSLSCIATIQIPIKATDASSKLFLGQGKNWEETEDKKVQKFLNGRIISQGQTTYKIVQKSKTNKPLR